MFVLPGGGVDLKLGETWVSSIQCTDLSDIFQFCGRGLPLVVRASEVDGPEASYLGV